ncbi:MAG: site-specific DNA-methyltransferase [Pseudomonadota bacterium]
MDVLKSGSVALIVTSPPYPMIEMWDELFVQHSTPTLSALKAGHGMEAFELMHRLLDPVWREVYRVLKPGGIACINIGDATRTLGDDFILYPNHARILNAMLKIGFTPLPEILWRKQTNAPNKFMGSGMMPPGAYVTLEHEHILILRKGGKREFPGDDDKQNRRASAFFWEERNHWFSDVWMDLKGTTQKLNDNDARHRSAAYPFEVPYRLINMFSVKGDIVLDPFLGTGATMAAAMAAGRNSAGFELFTDFLPVILSRLDTLIPFSNERIESRLAAHLDFIRNRIETKGPLKHRNAPYGFPVVTNQETLLLINEMRAIRKVNDTTISVTYDDRPQPAFVGSWENSAVKTPPLPAGLPRSRKKKATNAPKQVQQKFLDI